MTEHVTKAVLAQEISKVRSETHVCDCRLQRAPLTGRKSLEQDEPFPVDEILTKIRQEMRKLG